MHPFSQDCREVAIHLLFYIRKEFIRKWGSNSPEFKKFLRNRWGSISLTFKKFWGSKGHWKFVKISCVSRILYLSPHNLRYGFYSVHVLDINTLYQYPKICYFTCALIFKKGLHILRNYEARDRILRNCKAKIDGKLRNSFNILAMFLIKTYCFYRKSKVYCSKYSFL